MTPQLRQRLEAELEGNLGILELGTKQQEVDLLGRLSLDIFQEFSETWQPFDCETPLNEMWQRHQDNELEHLTGDMTMTGLLSSESVSSWKGDLDGEVSDHQATAVPWEFF